MPNGIQDSHALLSLHGLSSVTAIGLPLLCNKPKTPSSVLIILFSVIIFKGHVLHVKEEPVAILVYTYWKSLSTVSAVV